MTKKDPIADRTPNGQVAALWERWAADMSRSPNPDADENDAAVQEPRELLERAARHLSGDDTPGGGAPAGDEEEEEEEEEVDPAARIAQILLGELDGLHSLDDEDADQDPVASGPDAGSQATMADLAAEAKWLQDVDRPEPGPPSEARDPSSGQAPGRRRWPVAVGAVVVAVVLVAGGVYIAIRAFGSGDDSPGPPSGSTTPSTLSAGSAPRLVGGGALDLPGDGSPRTVVVENPTDRPQVWLLVSSTDAVAMTPSSGLLEPDQTVWVQTSIDPARAAEATGATIELVGSGSEVLETVTVVVGQ